MENLHGFAHENISEALWKHLALDFLHRNNFFHPKHPKCLARGLRDHWNNPLSPIHRKKGEEVAAQRAGLLLEEATLLRKCFGRP